MLICPDCGEGLPESPPHCLKCSWRGRTREEVPIYLSSASLQDPVCARYLENYEEISEQDLQKGILDEGYVQTLVKTMVALVDGVRGAEVADIGCGQGRLTRALIERGAARVTAVDLSLPYLRRAVDEPGVRPILADAENLPFADEFDIVVSTDVLEHVLNVGSFLFSLNQAMKLGGMLYIRVPFREDLLPYAPQMGCPHRFVHLRSFDRPLLKRYLERAGFKVLQTRLDGFWPSTPQPFWQRERTGSSYSAIARRWMSGNRVGRVTGWPPWLARLLMVPQEIHVKARKVRALVAPADCS